MFDPKVLIDPYSKVSYRLLPDGSYIVWRVGTGWNIELLQLKVPKESRRSGKGTILLKVMLEALRVDPPHHTVFGFTRIDNSIAQSFYLAMGFELSKVKGVYKDGSAILFSQKYRNLCRLHNIPG